MQAPDHEKLLAFSKVAEYGGFTRAAARLGVTTSAISQSVRKLETRLGMPLVSRTTRKIQLTKVGARLAAQLRKMFDGIDEAIAEAQVAANREMGMLRLTTSAVGAELIIRPHLAELGQLYPNMTLQFSINEQVIDIVGQSFDAAIRRGDFVGTDLVSHQISPDAHMLAVASPAYLATAPAIREPVQLREHNCIGIRALADGAMRPWRFTDGTSFTDVAVDGTVTVDTTTLALAAALDGAGIAYLASDYLAPYLRSGQLVAVLEEWAITRPGFHLCYAGRRQASQPLVTLARFLEARSDMIKR